MTSYGPPARVAATGPSPDIVTCVPPGHAGDEPSPPCSARSSTGSGSSTRTCRAPSASTSAMRNPPEAPASSTRACGTSRYGSASSDAAAYPASSGPGRGSEAMRLPSRYRPNVSGGPATPSIPALFEISVSTRSVKSSSSR